MRHAWAGWLIAAPVLVHAAANQHTQLSRQEQQQVDQQIQQFYQRPSAAQMNQKVQKYSVATGQAVPAGRINPQLRKAGQQARNPLQRQAQAKATDAYQQHYCNSFLSKKFPGLKCKEQQRTGRATREGNDRVEDLVETWMARPVLDLTRIPSSGKTSLDLWSDDYWRIQWGITSYRYSARRNYRDYDAAIAAYQQPRLWDQLVPRLNLTALARQVHTWSPSEKYDITVGDTDFTLTNQQKSEGDDLRDRNGKVAEWMGICHGWAGANIIVPNPKRAVSVVGARGTRVTWLPHDIRAMASLNWANGNSPTNFIGGRCDHKNVATYANGRLRQQECFDNNPATMVHALGNMIGIERKSFVMDKTFDHEVWNQPVYSYQLTYFNPLNPAQRSTNWRQVAVNYDARFKARDRFQRPLTRGKRLANGRYDDRGVKKVVGVIMTIVYLSEATPRHATTPARNVLLRVTYRADLEIHTQGRGRSRKYVALGGEWHSNAHPDFLWVPTKNSTAYLLHDRINVRYSTNRAPNRVLAGTAEDASDDGYPLCQVLKPILQSSSGGSYRCRWN